jgi:hypothetical protein
MITTTIYSRRFTTSAKAQGVVVAAWEEAQAGVCRVGNLPLSDIRILDRYGQRHRITSMKFLKVDDSLSKAMYNAAESLAKSQHKGLAPLLLFAAKTLYLGNLAREAEDVVKDLVD